MSLENQATDLGKIIELSEIMLESARHKQWDNLTHVESERKRLLSALFSQPISLQTGEIADGIRSILSRDREIMRLAVTKRDDLRGALQKVKQGKDAMQAYAAV